MKSFFNNFFTTKNALLLGGIFILGVLGMRFVFNLFWGLVALLFFLLPFIVLYFIIRAIMRKMKKTVSDVYYRYSPQTHIAMGRTLTSEESSLQTTIDRIRYILDTLKNIDKGKYSGITEHMEDIIELEEVIPQIISKHQESGSYVRENAPRVLREIKTLEEKIIKESNSNLRDIYEKTLLEKNEMLKELYKIKEGLAEWESKLQLILSTLEKIEALIHSSEFSKTFTHEDVDILNSQLEVFSGSVKNISKMNL